MNLRVGDWVRVRSHAEILATLDERACFEGIPFMPQMVRSCGQRFRVSKRAHKFCDFGPSPLRMTRAVFLEDMRCDGRTYGGCEMDCLIVWKDVWLERVDGAEISTPNSQPDVRANSQLQDNSQATASLEALHALAMRGTRRTDGPSSSGEAAFACQATQLPAATVPQSIWDVRQYVEDYRSGNAPLGEIVSVLSFLVYHTIATSGIGLGWFLRRAYDVVQGIRGGSPYPFREGHLPNKSRTPSIDVGIRPGELVKIKTYDEVLQTVTEDLTNRGMNFAPEMVQYCGKTFRVGKRLSRIMNEKTGHILELKNPCLVLDGATCRAHFARPLLCPRGMSPYWREVWLERIAEGSGGEPAGSKTPPP